MSTKSRTARLSIFSNSFLVILNLIVGLISGSVSILSEAVHTLIDLFAAIMAFFSVRIADTPADKSHPYGHGKFENVSGVIEAFLIFLASGFIIYHAVLKLIDGSALLSDSGLKLGFIIMIVSAIVNLIVSRKLYRVARETDSVALKADALHLSTHVYTSLGVGVSLLVIFFTGWHFLDPVAAIVVASYILKEAFEILIEAFKPLIDNSLPEEEQLLINEIIKNNLLKGMNYHMLRTRKTGSFREIDFHLEVPGNLTVADSHDLCDKIEENMMECLANLKVTIHVEPEGYHKK